MKKRLGQFLVGLVVVGAFGVLILATFGAGRLGWATKKPKEDEKRAVEIPPVTVETREIRLESIEITDSYSGMIRPWERFSLAFEVGGRVTALGTNAEGKSLDDGDRVRAGQVLATLDDRIARARLREAKAKQEQAQSDLKRAQNLKERGIGAITETDYQNAVTTQTLAETAVTMAEKNLEDTTLISPVDAVISKRLVNAGESVNPQQIVMRLIQVDRLLLVVGVPEAYVGHVDKGQSVHVELLAKDRFRRKRPTLEGRVFQVAESAEETTGLFEIEIEIPNTDRLLKPGLIALGHIVVDRMQGFRIPMTCPVYRDERMLLFSVDDEQFAKEYELTYWIEEGQDMVLSALPPEHRRVVMRGQHRLVHGRTIREVDTNTPYDATPQKPPIETARKQ